VYMHEEEEKREDEGMTKEDGVKSPILKSSDDSELLTTTP